MFFQCAMAVVRGIIVSAICSAVIPAFLHAVFPRWFIGPWGSLLGLGVLGVSIIAGVWVAYRNWPTQSPCESNTGNPAESENLTSRSQLWLQFAAGAGFLAFLATPISLIAEISFMIVFPVLFAFVVSCGALLLAWQKPWVRRADSERRQFGISSVLLLTTIAAIFLGLVRWLMCVITERTDALDESIPLFLALALFALVAAIPTIILGLHMTESLLWGAVWIVRRPWFRRMMRARRGRRP